MLLSFAVVVVVRGAVTIGTAVTIITFVMMRGGMIVIPLLLLRLLVVVLTSVGMSRVG